LEEQSVLVVEEEARESPVQKAFVYVGHEMAY
jgi:hypothetical protein